RHPSRRPRTRRQPRAAGETFLDTASHELLSSNSGPSSAESMRKKERGCQLRRLQPPVRWRFVSGTGLRRERDQVPQRGEARQGLAFELPDALARQVELVTDRLEGPRLALEAEAELEDPPLALGQGLE